MKRSARQRHRDRESCKVETDYRVGLGYFLALRRRKRGVSARVDSCSPLIASLGWLRKLRISAARFRMRNRDRSRIESVRPANL